MDANSFVACNSCASVNRVSLSRAAASAPVCARCKGPLAITENVSHPTDKSFPGLIEKSPLPVIVDFWAEWCPPCKTFAPAFAEVAKKYAGRLVFAKVDTEANPHISAASNIRGIPAILVFKDGKEIARHAGAMSAAAFSNWVSQFA